MSDLPLTVMRYHRLHDGKKWWESSLVKHKGGITIDSSSLWNALLFFFSLSFYHCPKLPYAVIWRGILENRVKSALTNCTLIENNNNGCVGYIVLRVLLSMFRRQRWKINGTEVKSQETLFCLLLLGCLTFTVQNGARAAWLWTTVFQRLSAQRGKFLSAHL